MIEFNDKPYVVQNVPIKGWDGMRPKRSGNMEVRVNLDFSCGPEDREKVDALVKAAEALFKGAVFKESGNPVVAAKLAVIEAADGRKGLVPASSLPKEMLNVQLPENSSADRGVSSVGQKYLGDGSERAGGESGCDPEGDTRGGVHPAGGAVGVDDCEDDGDGPVRGRTH